MLLHLSRGVCVCLSAEPRLHERCINLGGESNALYRVLSRLFLFELFSLLRLMGCSPEKMEQQLLTAINGIAVCPMHPFRCGLNQGCGQGRFSVYTTDKLGTPKVCFKTFGDLYCLCCCIVSGLKAQQMSVCLLFYCIAQATLSKLLTCSVLRSTQPQRDGK